MGLLLAHPPHAVSLLPLKRESLAEMTLLHGRPLPGSGQLQPGSGRRETSTKDQGCRA